MSCTSAASGVDEICSAGGAAARGVLAAATGADDYECLCRTSPAEKAATEDAAFSGPQSIGSDPTGALGELLVGLSLSAAIPPEPLVSF